MQEATEAEIESLFVYLYKKVSKILLQYGLDDLVPKNLTYLF